MLRHRVTVALVAPVLLAAACSSSGGSGKAPTTNGSTAAPTSSSASSDAAAAALANKMRTALSGLTSAHIAVDAGALGGKSSGDVAYRNGQASASDIVIGSGANRAEVVTVGDKTYAKLPPGRNTSGKPWVLVSANSKNEFVRGLASSVNLSKAAASLPAIADVVATATSVHNKGNGHYALSVEPARNNGSTLGALLAEIGQQSVPIDVYLDSKSRPTRIVISVKLGTQSLPVTIDVSRFNAPLHIVAPPASEVAT